VCWVFSGVVAKYFLMREGKKLENFGEQQVGSSRVLAVAGRPRGTVYLNLRKKRKGYGL